MVSFFQIATSLLAYVATFSGQLYFGRSYFFTLFQRNYFDITVTFLEQLFLQNSCFLLLFENSHFFAGVSFSEQLLFQSETSTEQPFRKPLTAVVFRGSYFFRRNYLGQRYLKKNYVIKAGTSAQHQPFQKSNIPDYLLFLESCLFRAAIFSKDATFYSSYIFRRVIFYNILFQKSDFFTATPPFHSYTSYLFIRF